MSAVVRATVDGLLVADVESADRAELERVVRRSGAVRAWLDSIDVRCARRSRELAASGRAGAPESTLTDRGRRSGRDAAAAAEREVVCSSMGGFEDALAGGTVSSGHVDAVARATKRLDNEVREEFAEHEAELLAAAAAESVEAFERRAKALAKRLESQRATSDADELDRQRSLSAIKRWTDKATGMCHTHLELDPIRNSSLWNTLNRQVDRARQDQSNRAKPWMQLQIDTLIDTLITGAGVVGGSGRDDADDAGDHRNGGAGIGTGRRRGADPSARVPEATVLIDHRTLVDGLHDFSICELEDGTSIPISTMRRLLCDCEVLPVVLGSRGEALDAGRSSRTVTRSQRRALRAMYRTCASPDCTVAFGVCRIHHLRWWWRDLGPTDLDNLIPLCERHHHLVHEGGWTLTMTADRVTTWTRPDGTVAQRAMGVDRAPVGVSPPGRVGRRAMPGRPGRSAGPGFAEAGPDP